jgi:hypothetical protein
MLKLLLSTYPQTIREIFSYVKPPCENISLIAQKPACMEWKENIPSKEGILFSFQFSCFCPFGKKINI